MFETLNNLKLKHSIQISKFKFRIATTIVAFALLFASSTAVQAQTISLSIWPPLLEVQMVPGKSVIQNYQLANNTDSFLEITPAIAPFEPDGENGQIKILPADNSPYFFSFTTKEKFNKSFTLNPKETRQLSLKITLPKNNAEKDYYFTLLFSSSANRQDQKNQAASVTKIGTNILLTSSSVEKPALLGRIYRFSTPMIIDSFSPVDFDLVLENFGRTFFKPFGQITVAGLLKQKGEIKLLEQNILSGSKRKLTLSSYKPHLPLGPFKAKLEFSLNEEGALPVLSSQIVFWYLPYRLIALSAGIFLLLTVRKNLIKGENKPKHPLDNR